MKRKISITFLLAIMAIFVNVCTFANDVILISPRPVTSTGSAMEYISKSDDDAIKLQMDGEYVDFTDENGNVVNPVMINSRTMIPVAKIFSLLECPYVWNSEERKVIATADNKEIALTIDSEILKVKDLQTGEEEEIILDSVPVIRNNRTLVPVRVITQCLGKTVGWDNENRTVIIIDFNKLTEEFKAKVPNLQKVFDLELDSMESFKSTSDIEGKIIYNDKEDKKKNESVNVEGSLELNMNKEKQFEMYMDLEFSGKGTIYDSIKEVGAEKFKVGIVMDKDKSYMMTVIDGKEVWNEADSDVDVSELSSMNLSNVSNSYESIVDQIKESVGELNVSSYATLKQIIDIMAEVYSEENFSISGSGSTKTIKFNMDIMDILAEILGQNIEELENLKMKISAVEKISNKKVDTAKVTLEMSISELVSEESLEMEFELDMKYKNINKDFEIKIPEVK